MGSGLLSVIVPVYNVSLYLEYCVQSLLAQTYHNLEIILIDDGSTDGSGILCDTLAAGDDRIIVIHQANAGVSAARNAGLDAASGDFIGFVDPDDWCEPEMFAHLIGLMEADGTDAAFCSYWEDFDEPGLPPIGHSPERVGKVDGEEAFYQCMIGVWYGYFTSVWNKCFRKEEIAGHYFPLECRIAEDELWLAWVIPAVQSVSLTNRRLYHWRQRNNSACHKQVVDDRWYKALETKRAAADILAKNPAHTDLAYGKVYSDLFHCVWIAHCSGTGKDESYFREHLKPYRTCFYRSSTYSILKKIRFLMLDWMCRLHLPIPWIEILGNTTSQKLRIKRRG